MTIARVQQRMQAPPDVHRLAWILSRIQLKAGPTTNRMRWLQATVGNQLRITAIDEVLFFQATDKYTRVVTQGAEALIRQAPEGINRRTGSDQFWQIHRSTIVNVRAVANVSRDIQGRLNVSIKDLPERLEVSRGYAHLFKSL